MNDWNASRFDSIPAEWLGGDEPNVLGPGAPRREMGRQILQADPRSWFPPGASIDTEMARACQAGLLLRHNCLDESHTISQSIGSATGSYWHGIMHRREPDFSNAKYWFRKVGRHPVFERLATEAARLAAAHECRLARQIDGWNRWDPFAFVDACEAALDDPKQGADLCRAIALAEWRLLFEFSWQSATPA